MRVTFCMGYYVRRSREDRIREIQLSALEVFLHKGYNNATMEDIIKATSLSKGGFYHYYKNKRDILADLIRTKNYNYLKQKINIKSCKSPDDVCKTLAQAFVERMIAPEPQNKLHLMVAMELANNNMDFYDLYYEIERESLDFIVSVFKSAPIVIDLTKDNARLMLLYRINNTLHFVRNLYTDKDEWGVDTKLLYDLYYNMLHELVQPSKAPELHT